MYLPTIKESGSFHIEEVKYYPERKYDPRKNLSIPGYFDITLKCNENRITREIGITIFESELGELAKVKFDLIKGKEEELI